MKSQEMREFRKRCRGTKPGVRLVDIQEPHVLNTEAQTKREIQLHEEFLQQQAQHNASGHELVLRAAQAVHRHDIGSCSMHNGAGAALLCAPCEPEQQPQQSQPQRQQVQRHRLRQRPSSSEAEYAFGDIHGS